MRQHIKLMLSALVVTCVMASAVGTASAQRLSVSNRNFRVNWNPLSGFGAGGISNPTLRCRLTLEGSFHANTFQKSIDSLIGYVTRAIVQAPPCTGGSATILTASLPWHVTYHGFIGALPNIVRVRMIVHRTAVQFGATIFGTNVLCLYQEGGTLSNAAAFEIVREVGGNVNVGEVDPAIRLQSSSGGLCPPEIGLEGVAQVFLLGSNTTRIRLTLI